MRAQDIGRYKKANFAAVVVADDHLQWVRRHKNRNKIPKYEQLIQSPYCEGSRKWDCRCKEPWDQGNCGVLFLNE